MLHKCLFKIPLWREIDNVPSFLLIFTKNFSKIIGGGEFRFLLSKLMFTHSVYWVFFTLLTQIPAEAVAMEQWKDKTRYYHQKLKVQSRIAKQFRTWDLRKWETFKAVYLSLMIRGFELVTRESELVTRGFVLVTCGFKLLSRGFELVTRGFELLLLNFNSWF